MVVTGKEGDNGVVEYQFYSPHNRTKWQSFQRAIYDKSSNQICGRSPKNWGQLLVFYSIFYIVLAALFAVCMQGLFSTLDERKPKWQLERSLIGINPGLGFRPISNQTSEGSLIWYNITNHTTIDKWILLTNEFLEAYQKDQTGKNFANCDFNKPPPDGKVCVTDITQFGNCSPSNFYGYNTSSPCVFLKLNRIFGWEPDYYKDAVDGMPSDLKSRIDMTKREERAQIWVSCNGTDAFDKENIGDFSYSPYGFAGYYYPFKNYQNYLSPIVAVQVLNVTPNVVVSIECRAWAKNIEYRGGSLYRAGSVTFEIQIDSEYKSQTQPTSSPTVTVNPTPKTSDI